MSAWEPSRFKALMMGPPPVRVAVAESVTCGGIAQRIGRIPGASEFFLGSITAYDPEAKVRHLGVARQAARTRGAVSREVAEQMARGACVFFGADAAVATTGFAEPAPAHGESEPMAWWAVAVRSDTGWRVKSGTVVAPGLSRAPAQDRFAEEAIARLADAIARTRGR